MASLACFTGNFFGRDALIASAVLIMAMIVALAYMFSKFMHKPEWEAWAKNESYQVFVSCVLAASMILLADISCTASFELTKNNVPPGQNAFQITDRFLSYHYDEITKSILTFHSLKLVIDYMADLQVVSATNPLFITYAYPGLSAVSQNLSSVLTILSVLAGNIMVQKVGLQLIEQMAFSVFLPVGLVLRVFPFSRDAGAFLIAVAFGLYIVLPLTYVMASEVMANILPNEDPPKLLGVLPMFPVIGAPVFFVANGFAGPVWQMFEQMKNLNFVLVATFFPALGMTITITFIKSLSKSILHLT